MTPRRDYGYDSLGQVTSGRRKWSDTTAVAGQQYDYSYDDIGNRKTMILNSHAGTYTANSLNQYTQRTMPGMVDVLGTANSNATVTVNNQPTSRHGEYFHGQLTGLTNSTSAIYTNISVVGVRKNAGTNQQDVVTTITGKEFVAQSPEQFSYDVDGNMLSDGRWTNMTWDAENRLVSMQTAASTVSAGAPKLKLEFGYDSSWRRTRKKVYSWHSEAWLLTSELRYVYDGWNLIAELNGNDAVVRSYAWGLDLSGSMQGAGGVGGMLVANAGGSSNFAAYDGNGNVAALVDAASSGFAGLYEYAPFGETLRLTGTMAGACPLRFSTKYQDEETGWLNYTFRFYLAKHGRWLTKDPMEELGGLNLYGFAGNHPVDSIDILGLIDCAVLKRHIEMSFSRFNRDSDLLRDFLTHQYDVLRDLYRIDRAQDLGFALTGNLAAKSINSARVALTSTRIGQGSSLGVDLVRGGSLTGPGLASGTSFQTAGMGGAVVGPLVSRGIGSGLNATAKNFTRNWTTEGLRQQLQDLIDQLTADLNNQLQELRNQIAEYRQCCK